MMKRKLKIGLLMDEMAIPAWSYRLIERILQSDYASIDLIVLNDVRKSTKKTLYKKIRDNWGSVFSTIIAKLLTRIHDILIDRVSCEPDAFEMKNLNNILSDVPVLKVRPIRKKLSDYLFEEQKGHISLLIIDGDGNYDNPVKVLERPYHMSYPFVFEWENELHMVPETGGNRTVELYRCTEFPYKWELVMNLMENVEAYEATLFYHGNKWWIFANMIENRGASSWDELFLFHSENLLSTDWIPHPLNPVISDVKSARPAGKIFEQNGKLYRPSQNSSVRYGYGFNINEITTLDEHEYLEQVIAVAEPKWNKDILATHTFNYDHGLSVIDGLMRRRR